MHVGGQKGVPGAGTGLCKGPEGPVGEPGAAVDGVRGGSPALGSEEQVGLRVDTYMGAAPRKVPGLWGETRVWAAET